MNEMRRKYKTQVNETWCDKKKVGSTEAWKGEKRSREWKPPWGGYRLIILKHTHTGSTSTLWWLLWTPQSLQRTRRNGGGQDLVCESTTGPTQLHVCVQDHTIGLHNGLIYLIPQTEIVHWQWRTDRWEQQLGYALPLETLTGKRAEWQHLASLPLWWPVALETGPVVYVMLNGSGQAMMLPQG